MNIADICTREVVVADRDSSLQRAAELMRENHVGTLLVTAGSSGGMQAVGIVTDRDLVIEAMARGLDAARTEVGQLADGKLAAVQAAASVDESSATMKERGVGCLIFAADGGRLFGVVSLADLLAALAHELAALAPAVRSGIEREPAERPPLPARELAAVHIPAYPTA